jgi:hypothetical protein
MTDRSIKKKSVLITYIGILALLLTVTYYISVYGLNGMTQKGNEKQYVHTITVQIKTPTWSLTYSSSNTSNITVADLLFECCTHFNITIEKEYWVGYNSFFITSIGNYFNGDDGRYWQYYVNEQYADVGCSQYIVEDNDVICWNFEKSSWDI